MRQIRLYGRAIGHSSHVVVTRGFASVLPRYGEVFEYALDDMALEEDPPGGALADLAFFTGPLNRVQAMHQNARHAERYTMIAPNSDRIPPRILHAVVEASSSILVPSCWAREVVTEQLASMKLLCPIWVTPHGVATEFRVHASLRTHVANLYRDGVAFRVLHCSTSERERKGTRELIQAWRIARQWLPTYAELVLVLDLEADIAIAQWLVEEQIDPASLGVRIVSRFDKDASSMAEMLSYAHVVCQPSRGEGFGLIPLEARAIGVPVVATACTGHSEHMPASSRDGVIVVPHGPLAPIDDYPDARAPTVPVDALADSLRQAYERWEALDQASQAAADDVAAEWSWSVKLWPVLDQILGEPR